MITHIKGLIPTIKNSPGLILFAAILVACSTSENTNTNQSEQPLSVADLIFVGDNIVTMDESEATAVAVAGDRIVAVGNRDEVMAMQGSSTRLVELGSRALLPGFIDAHGHFGGVATYSALLDLSSPPVGSMVVEGYVDLLFETKDGLVIVDYKTDPVTSSEEVAQLMDRYRIQGGSYALCLSEATGKPVAKVVFFFLHSANEVVMGDLDGAMETVRGRACASNMP